MRQSVSYFHKLKKSLNWFIVSIIFGFSILRIPSLVEPDWYGDEGITQVVAIAIKHGRLLYKDVWDNKPPLLYVIYSVLNGDLFYIKLLSLIFGVLSIIIFYILAKKIFQSKIQVIFSTVSFSLLFGLPVLEGNIANAENFMLFPMIFSAFLLMEGIKNNSSRNYIFSGLILSLAFLIKIVAIFDFFAFLIFIFFARLYENFYFYNIKNYFKKLSGFGFYQRIWRLLFILKNEIYFVTAFFIPIFTTSLYFFLKGTFAYYLNAVFLENVGYVGYGNYKFFPMGVLIFKTILLFFGILFLIKIRKKIDIKIFFIYLWVFFSVFNSLFSQRPYTHYLLLLLPSVCLFLGYAIKEKKLILLNLSIFSILFFVVFNIFGVQKGFYRKTLPYYNNYLDFIIGRKSTVSYQSFFDANTPRDYDIANFIKINTEKDENIFLWSDSAQIYYLSDKLPPGRYVAAYHITYHRNGIIETEKAINQTKTKYIITTKNTQEIENILTSYKLKYLIKETKIYERKI